MWNNIPVALYQQPSLGQFCCPKQPDGHFCTYPHVRKQEFPKHIGKNGQLDLLDLKDEMSTVFMFGKKGYMCEYGQEQYQWTRIGSSSYDWSNLAYDFVNSNGWTGHTGCDRCFCCLCN